MKTIEINGIEIRTNLGGNKNGLYPRLKDNMNVKSIPFGMSEHEFIKEMVAKGYTTITFYEETTCVRGYHHVYARCK